ncbi:hypothetical protein M885DRAFT_519004 [Pelagophyceae sp. CCMP2097]|nr:hypothetical protein M885DRAFT_519004 [Pelagophyceae sp. CCMP2097]
MTVVTRQPLSSVTTRGKATLGKATRSRIRVKSIEDASCAMSPLEVLQQLLGALPEALASEPRGQFVAPTPEQIAQYTIPLLALIPRTTDPASDLLPEQLTARNKFGVTLLHKACRFPNWILARHLAEAHPDLAQARDDLGRVPLHDACWNEKVDFGVVDMLIAADISALCAPDNRGHTPLCFAPEAAWPSWRAYLLGKRDVLRAALGAKEQPHVRKPTRVRAPKAAEPEQKSPLTDLRELPNYPFSSAAPAHAHHAHGSLAGLDHMIARSSGVLA